MYIDDPVSILLYYNVRDFLEKTCQHNEICSRIAQRIEQRVAKLQFISKTMWIGNFRADPFAFGILNGFTISIRNHESDFGAEKPIPISLYNIKKVCAFSGHKYREFHS